jgi:dTDP-4-dehydrorhamnose 3,5-epimerase
VLRGAKKDPQLITSSWSKLQEPIGGVFVREVLHVPGDLGTLTELHRPDWDPYGPVAQVFHLRIRSGGLSAWHCHLRTVDRLFAVAGSVKFVLFDDREESTTRGRVNEFNVGEERPALIVVPEGVWHGVQNLDAVPASIINMPTHAYTYEDPDHYRLPPDSPGIPYTWGRRPTDPPRP